MASRPKPQDFDDRRQASRVDLDRQYSMRLDPRDGREPIVCEVLDFSVTGMRLELPAGAQVPDDVQILIGSLSHTAKVVWRKDRVIGVDLVDEHHSIID